MKIVVTHMRPDLDAVGGVWAIKRFLPDWEEAEVKFVPAGERLSKSKIKNQKSKLEVIEKIGADEVIHVDTGMGPLDHHQTSDDTTCGAKRAWEYVKKVQSSKFKVQSSEGEAGDRLMEMICEIDHFKEVTWPDPASDRYEITVSRILDGLKLLEKDNDEKVVEFGLACLDALYRIFQNKVWAEHELAEKGVTFDTRWGKGIGVETFNDDVIHLSQRMGYRMAVRKDPKKGYVRIKASPARSKPPEASLAKGGKPAVKSKSIDLTAAYEELKKRDPDATWFLHVSKRMLLNGTTKNPTMKPTRLSLGEIIEVLKTV